MKRIAWGIPLLLFAVVSLGGIMLTRSRPSAVDPQEAPGLAADLELLPLAGSASPGSAGVGFPPGAPSGPGWSPGWPFAPLPPITKADQPELKVEIQVSRRDSLPLERPPHQPLTDSAVAAASTAPLWLVPAVAAGELGAGSRHARSVTTPEPATLLLLATGIAACALVAGRRAPRG